MEDAGAIRGSLPDRETRTRGVSRIVDAHVSWSPYP
jgi:hypothetical protein